MNDIILTLEFGNETGDLLNSILGEINDDALDSMEVSRTLATTTGLVSEPITIAATITLSSLLLPHITRIIERWLENQRQDKARKNILKAAGVSPETAKELVDLEKKHADVSVSYSLFEPKKKA